MPKFSVKCGNLVGFAAETVPLGSTSVKVLTNGFKTSDDLVFHVWMSHITSIFLSKIPIHPAVVHKLLVILHEDNNADVYINDFSERALAKCKEPVKVGEPVLLSNTTDITDLRFPGITIGL